MEIEVNCSVCGKPMEITGAEDFGKYIIEEYYCPHCDDQYKTAIFEKTLVKTIDNNTKDAWETYQAYIDEK